jgi:hypothetical protein
VAVKIIPRTVAAPAERPGTAADPQAKPGFMCFWLTQDSNVNQTVGAGGFNAYSISRFGFDFQAVPAAANAGSTWAGGAWAVTAP